MKRKTTAVKSSNPQIHQVDEWRKQGWSIVEDMEIYEWNYRKKICSKCSKKKQRELNCFKVENFVDYIQETYCRKLENARTRMFSTQIEKFFENYPLGQ